MRDVRIYARGQIWFWDDPTYGKKSEPLIMEADIPTGERALHYSRYVLIVQHVCTSETTEGGYIPNILVAPISTTDFVHAYDIPIQIYPNHEDKGAHIQLGRIFPASPSQLKEFIGHVSNNIMHLVEDGLREILLDGPSYDVEPTDFPSVQFSVVDAEPIIDVPTIAPTNTVVEEQPTSMWTRERMKEFLELYASEGATAVSKKFFIKESTAKTYRNKFKKIIGSEEPESSPKGVGKMLDDINTLRDDRIQTAINRLSQILSNTLETNNLFGRITKKHGFYSPMNDERAFYEITKKGIFWAIINTIKVNRDDNDKHYYMPELTENTKYLEVFYLLDKLLSDNTLSVVRNSNSMLRRYYRIYNNAGTISGDFVHEIGDAICRRFSLTESGKSEIYKQVEKMFVA